ncbi:MAG TPA: hypothetical protein DDX33_06475 [Rikenellaceae bacterium]|nr:hypothetical protein [Rikenellaceae bacterium]
MKYLQRIILAAMLSIILASCQKPAKNDGIGEPSSLSISVCLPSITLDTKAREMYSGDAENAGKIITDPFGTSLEGWTNYEKIIDAREFYQLTVFLVDKTTGYLVGYRNLFYNTGTDMGDMTPADSEYGANGWYNGSTTVTNEQYGSQAMMTFRYDHPLHTKNGSSTESLQRGSYRLIAVANVTPITINATDKDGNTYTRKYDGLTDTKNSTSTSTVYIADHISSIISEFNAQTSPKKFNEYKSYKDLMDFYMTTSDDFLCSIAPQPLSKVMDFELRPGENSISCQLIRSWARLRITIENVSHSDLTLHNISFGDNTTRNESYLFFAPGNESVSFIDPHTEDGEDKTKYGAPNIWKPSDQDGEATGPFNALVSSVKETIIKGIPLDESNSSNTNRKILFDGYILDGNGQNNPFTYHVSLEYPNKKTYRLVRAKNSDGSWAVNESKPDEIEEGGLYVIQNQESTKRILYAGEGQLETEILECDSHYNLIDKEYLFEPVQVFRFTRKKDASGNGESEEVTNIQGDNPGKKESYPIFYITTYDDLYHIGNPYGDFSKNIPLEPNAISDHTAYVVRNDGYRTSHPNDRYLSFWSTKKAQKTNWRAFINIHGDYSKQNLVDGWSDPDGGSTFYLHKVEKEEIAASFDKDVTLSTVDPMTAVSSPVEAISRNDFINILITVSYNEHSGEIDFTVKEWNTGGGNIEFN